MIFLKLLIVTVISASMGFSTRYFSPLELQDRFEKGQKLYALGDYEKAIEHYQAILATQSNAMIDVERVDVTVDEFILPVRVAATYQLANTHNKLGLDKLRRSEILRTERKGSEADARYEEALADLNTGLDFFQQLIVDAAVDDRTRVMAQYQTLETSFQLKKYDQVIEEGQTLLRDFPNSVYETVTFYDIAWSYFELGKNREAIEHYEQVLLLSPSGSHSDRSLLQIAECYDRLDNEERALHYLDRLISRYDFSAMTEDELRAMQTAKLSGSIKETARELVASAQLRKGDIYAGRGEINQALAAYAVVPEKYAAETRLVQNSYIRSAELVHEHRGVDAAIAAYKRAIREVEDELFQARTQLTVARLLFESAEYVEAVEEYQIYLQAYLRIAARAGFTADKVLFRIAQCYQSEGGRLHATDAAASQAAFDEALRTYQQLLREYQDTSLVPDAYFGLGFTQQLRGENTEARTHYRALVDYYPEHPAAANGLLQLARLDYEASDFQQAKAMYQRIRSDYPDADVLNLVHMELGLTHKRLSEIPQAITSLSAISDDWDQWAKIQVELAELHVSQGDAEVAQTILERALHAAGDETLQSQIHYIKGRLAFNQGNYRGAIRELDLALETADEKVSDGALFTRGASYYELAKELDARGDSAVARPQYMSSQVDMKSLLDRDPQAYLRDSAFRTLGAGMIRLGQQEEAASYYESLIADTDDPQEAATFQMLLTELYYDQEDFDRARRAARSLLSMTFDDDDKAGYYRKERAFSIIGNTLLQERKYREASRVFANGLEQYPNSGESANLAFSKAFSEFNSGSHAQAVTSFEDMLSRFPADRNAVHATYYLAHGNQLLTQFGKAADTFRELLDDYPGSSYQEEALYLIGENYYNERDFENASEFYDRLLAQYPRGRFADAALYARGWCDFEREDMEGGVARMSQLVAEYPTSEFSSKAQFTVGDYHYNKREYPLAIGAYQRVLNDYPDSEEVPKTRVLVAELGEIRASLEYNDVMKFLEAKQYDEAVAGLEEVAKKYPGTYTALAAYCNLGLTYEMLRQWRQAVDNYEKTLNQGGDDPQNVDVVSFARLHRDWIVENRL
ncbi:MAG: tetratricopeptide repeat protein [Candidatus Latescibacterota bacterium]|nr:tetratricopeptide repeat protein [Candidatus Latescibacterota bacterium]